jgi:hypothetical protein
LSITLNISITLWACALYAQPGLSFGTTSIGDLVHDGTNAPSSSFVLAENGTARAVIVAAQEAGIPGQFAAQELKTYLDRVTGASFCITNAPPASGGMILVGDSQFTRQLGIETGALKRDGFVEKRYGNAICIAGRDCKDFDVRAYVSHGRWKEHGLPECATLFGVYHFLETICGIRWYFPGEQGEIVPVRHRLAVDQLDVVEEPKFVFRELFLIGPGWRLRDYGEMGIADKDATCWGLRNRRSTLSVPLNHMPAFHSWVSRFGNTHSNWFALKSDGTRDNVENGGGSGNLCYSNPQVIEQIFREADGFFSGAAATNYGLAEWNRNVAYADYFSLLPQDGMSGCQCGLCKKKWSPDTQWSELVWGYVAEIGRRLEKRHPGKYVTCLAYSPYDRVPKTVQLPGNVLIGVATQGAGFTRDETLERIQFDLIQRWKEFSGNQVVLWTYNCREVFAPYLAGVPQLETRELGRFFKSVEDNICGGFYENDTTIGYQCLLNHYLYFRVMWNPSTDIDALVSEYCLLMFGDAHESIHAIMARAERLWMERILKFSKGHKTVSKRELWDEIYNRRELCELRAKMDQALVQAGNSPYRERVELFERRFLRPLFEAAVAGGVELPRSLGAR